MECINPNCIQYIQNGNELYYLKVKSSDNKEDIFELRKYNFQLNKTKKIKKYKSKRHIDEHTKEGMHTISVLLC